MNEPNTILVVMYSQVTGVLARLPLPVDDRSLRLARQGRALGEPNDARDDPVTVRDGNEARSFAAAARPNSLLERGEPHWGAEEPTLGIETDQSGMHRRAVGNQERHVSPGNSGGLGQVGRIDVFGPFGRKEQPTLWQRAFTALPHEGDPSSLTLELQSSRRVGQDPRRPQLAGRYRRGTRRTGVSTPDARSRAVFAVTPLDLEL